MPGRERTRGMGMGQRNGKTEGCCAEQQARSNMSPGCGRGMGRGQGGGNGRGFRRRFRGGMAVIPDAAPTGMPLQATDTLMQQPETLESTGEKITATIEEIDANTKEEQKCCDQ
jgi:hypothetical protein